MHVMLVGPEFEENLSLRYLAAALQQARHTASLARFDSPEYTDGVVQQALREKPGIVGLSMVFQVRAREFYALAQALRKAGYADHITAGGHFATFACEPILQNVPELDSIVRQEGEETLTALADALQRGATSDEMAEIPGMVVRRQEGGVLLAPPRHQSGSLDSLPYPVRDATPERHLGVPTAYLVGSRGCYADCEYCCIFAWHEAAVGKRYRMRTVGNIADEMAWLYHERGIRFFVFHDDNFFLPTAAGNRKRFEALRAEIRQRELNDIGLMLKLRPNDCDRENMLILKDIGLLRAFVGIENASKRQMKSLGRDSTVEDVQACLNTLRELDIYATFNILLFDPYTTLDDIAINLDFLRGNRFYPFNWCKVEPYAGTELEKRYAREGRLQGDYLGWDYRMDDPRARALYDLLLPAFYYRNFDYYGLANLNIGLGYHRQLLKHFYPDRCTPELCRRAQTLIEAINTNAIDLLEQTLQFVQEADLDNHVEIARFGEQLRRDSFHGQRVLSVQVETVLREIERAAGVRPEEAGSVPVAFVPLAAPPEETGTERTRLGSVPPSVLADAQCNSNFPSVRSQGGDSHRLEPILAVVRRVGALLAAPMRRVRSVPDNPVPSPDFARRSLLGALGSGLIWLLTGCRRSQNEAVPPNPAGGTTGKPTVGPSAKVIAPQGLLRVAKGYPETVAAWEMFTLEAVLLPEDAEVVGEPRVTSSNGTVQSVQPSADKRTLRIEFQPAGGSQRFNPNITITVAWTVRDKDSDTVVMTRAFLHVNENESYTFGYETPRPTIAEMAAPPIYHGPKPGS